MRRRRFSGNSSALGEAISFEDILTVITVLLLLRIIFMVPLVNIDKAKTVRSKADLYWSQEAAHVFSRPLLRFRFRVFRVFRGESLLGTAEPLR